MRRNSQPSAPAPGPHCEALLRNEGWPGKKGGVALCEIIRYSLYISAQTFDIWHNFIIMRDYTNLCSFSGKKIFWIKKMSGFPLEIQSKQYGTVCYSQITPLDGVKDKLNSTVSCTCIWKCTLQGICLFSLRISLRLNLVKVFRK